MLVVYSQQHCTSDTFVSTGNSTLHIRLSIECVLEKLSDSCSGVCILRGNYRRDCADSCSGVCILRGNYRRDCADSCSGVCILRGNYRRDCADSCSGVCILRGNYRRARRRPRYNTAPSTERVWSPSEYTPHCI
jgi:hypothetical protein